MTPTLQYASGVLGAAPRTLKFGKRTPSHKPRLNFMDFWTGVVPDVPEPVDYLTALPAWKMLGNDLWGDCVAAYLANFWRLISATLGVEYYPTLEEVLSLYATQNPNFPADDNGMDMQTALEYLVKNKWAGSQLVAFAAVDVTNIKALKAAISIFGGVGLGFNVLQSNMAQFDKGQPWGYSARSPRVGGHAVLLGGHTALASNDLKFVTWSEVTGFTDSDIVHEAEEAWLVIRPEHFLTHQFMVGVDQAKLLDLFFQLTGKTLHVPPPVPTPLGTWQVLKSDSASVLIQAPNGARATLDLNGAP